MQLFKLKSISSADISDRRLNRIVWLGYSDVEMIPIGHLIIIYMNDAEEWFPTSKVLSVIRNSKDVIITTEDVVYILEEIK